MIELVEMHHKKVYICGLDGDFKRNKFGELLDLLPYCDNIKKLTAKCDCGKDALFSHRLAISTDQVLIGSTNYVPLCRKCYQKHKFDCKIELKLRIFIRSAKIYYHSTMSNDNIMKGYKGIMDLDLSTIDPKIS